MKRFAFPLEFLVRYRAHLKHLAQLAVAKARAEVLASENRIERYRADYQKSARALEQEAVDGITSDRYAQFAAYLGGIQTKTTEEFERRERLLKALAEKQTELAEKNVNLKALENLKEQRKAAYYHKVLDNLQKEADDSVILRKARKESV